jgi:hypothetical protein
MVLYTVIPVESVLGEDDFELSEEIMVNISGVNALVRPDGNGYGTIDRLVSTNPDDFLNQDLAPGRTLWLGPGK